VADDETTTGEAPEQIDLTQVRVEGVMLQVASELVAIGAGQIGMIPQMINGGDAYQASLAIAGADALVGTVIASLPAGTEVPAPIEDLRRTIAELKLAFAEAVRQTAEAAPEAPAEPPEPERPKIWTPRGDV
jgi:hypothetical protein